jgi:transglutaminase-like putative cysteine protease
VKRYLYMAILAAAACKSSDASKSAPPKPEAADPWAKKSVDPKAIKDPDLAKMTELAQSGPGAAQYPQADAVVALDRDDITIKADQTIVVHHKQIVKLLDAQRGKGKFADVHIPFDSKRQTLTIDMARTVNSDGEARTASAEEIGNIVPSWLADATIYSDVRERVVSLPAVDKGSVIEIEYTRTTKPTPDSAYGGEQMLAQWDPVLDRTVTITAPAGVTPKLAVVGMKLDAKESSSGDTHTWTYHLENQPDQHPESGQPTDAAVLPRLVFGTQPSWSKVIEPVAARFLEKAIPQPLPAAVKAEADRIVAGATTDAEKAQKLFAFVAHDIRSVELPLGAAGYEPHSPEVVLQNKYADPRDKVGLLLALASAEGLSGRPVLVRSGKVDIVQSVPTIAQFDHIVAKLGVDHKDVWLNPANDHAQYDFVLAGQDSLVLPLEKGGSELGQRPADDPSKSVSHVTAQFALNAAGDLDATYKYEETGWYADRATSELRPLKGENLDKFFQRSAAELSASAVDKGHEVGDTNSVTGAFIASQKVSVPGYSAAQGNFRNFELPPVTLGFAEDAPSASLSKRKYPLWIGTPRTERADVSVQIPAGWKVAYVPPKLEGSADGVSYSSTCEAQGQTVTCHEEVKLDKLVLGTAQYAAFHDALSKLQAYERRVVLLTRG